ncbi:MAG: DUF3237 family protein, partial [Calditrichae bacterium]|nr:DUF3237 family protein [Calditrichia bacterium]NIV71989.1 DUF3237 family protein [Calditrichia bacterium]NIW79067.1 DUF3237 family protein [Calditrichia bacterium]
MKDIIFEEEELTFAATHLSRIKKLGISGSDKVLVTIPISENSWPEVVDASIYAGADFLTVRADGRFVLDLRLTIKTDGGVNIYAHENGILIPPQDENRIAQLRLNMQLSTASPQYFWVNQLQVWARGTVDWNSGEVRVRAYA